MVKTVVKHKQSTNHRRGKLCRHSCEILLLTQILYHKSTEMSRIHIRGFCNAERFLAYQNLSHSRRKKKASPSNLLSTLKSRIKVSVIVKCGYRTTLWFCANAQFHKVKLISPRKNCIAVVKENARQKSWIYFLKSAGLPRSSVVCCCADRKGGTTYEKYDKRAMARKHRTARGQQK